MLCCPRNNCTFRQHVSCPLHSAILQTNTDSLSNSCCFRSSSGDFFLLLLPLPLFWRFQFSSVLPLLIPPGILCVYRFFQVFACLEYRSLRSRNLNRFASTRILAFLCTALTHFKSTKLGNGNLIASNHCFTDCIKYSIYQSLCIFFLCSNFLRTAFRSNQFFVMSNVPPKS